MMSEKFVLRATLRCVASFVVLACMTGGCGKSGSEKGSAPEPVVSHLKDPELKAHLAEKELARAALERARQTIVAKMEAVVKRHNGDMKAAADDPEMVSLIRRAKDIETNLSSNRLHAAEMIRASAVKHANAQKNDVKKEVKK